MNLENKICDILRMLKRISRVPIFLMKYGIWRFCEVMYICFVLPRLMDIWAVWLKFYPGLKRKALKYFFVNGMVEKWRGKKDIVLAASKAGYRIRVEELGLSEENLNKLIKVQGESEEIVIGQIDYDGFLLSNFGLISGVPTVSPQQFLPRDRFKIELLTPVFLRRRELMSRYHIYETERKRRRTGTPPSACGATDAAGRIADSNRPDSRGITSVPVSLARHGESEPKGLGCQATSRPKAATERCATGAIGKTSAKRCPIAWLGQQSMDSPSCDRGNSPAFWNKTSP